MKSDTMLKKLSHSLRTFYPEKVDLFACPTCLESVPLADRHRVSVAHIVPQAAGGRLTTLICTRCNSEFGARQDKWFGEHVYLRKLDRSVLASRHQQGSFTIGGERVSGRFLANDERGFDFLIYTDKNDPKVLRRLEERFAHGRIDSIKIPLPYLKNRWLVSLGFLTAAYLLWFRQMGYSWAFQRHLDPIREWIRNPREGALPRTCIVSFGGKVFDEPWVGVGKIGDCVALLAGFSDRIVLLPTVHTPDLYSRLPDPLSGVLAEEDYEVIDIRGVHEFGEPMALIYRNWMMIWPDIASSGGPKATLYFPGDHQPSRLLEPISEAEGREMAKEAHAKYVKAEPFSSHGEGFTGRAKG